ncbi:MAG: hypothetical protein ACJ71P_08830 [Nitrososphaeraceae archaeon]
MLVSLVRRKWASSEGMLLVVVVIVVVTTGSHQKTCVFGTLYRWKDNSSGSTILLPSTSIHSWTGVFEGITKQVS